jgi:hypothetical protein
MRFQYVMLADKIGNKGGYGRMTPKAITIHHTAVRTHGVYDVSARLQRYCAYHNGRMPYHFYIPADGSNKIFITQYLSHYTHHNSNFYGNKETLAICIEGNFEVQNVTAKQKEMLQQLLADIDAKWFSANGYYKFDKHLNPSNNTEVFKWTGKKVKGLHWHNQIAQDGHSTDCCGKLLMPYVSNYRKYASVYGPKESVMAIDVKHFYQAVLNGQQMIKTLGREAAVAKYETLVKLLKKKTDSAELNLITVEPGKEDVYENISKVYGTGEEEVEVTEQETAEQPAQTDNSFPLSMSSILTTPLRKRLLERKFLVAVISPAVALVLGKLGLLDYLDEYTKLVVETILWAAPLAWVMVEGVLDRERIKLAGKLA